MKNIMRLAISCCIIAFVAFCLNKLNFHNFSHDISVTKAILAVESGVFLEETEVLDEPLADLQSISFDTIVESNFIPFHTPKADYTDVFIDMNNQTDKTVDVSKMLLEPVDLQIQSNTNSPEILIVHTHGTESFATDGNYTYFATIDRRSTDKEVSIAKIASILSSNLNDYGISTIYCDEYHDYPEYSGSYDRSLTSINYYLDKYPSIKMVIDVHRDAIIGNSGEHIYSTVDIDGLECAKLMFVVGTNASGLKHDNWQENLNTVVNLQAFIEQENEGIMRSINLRESRFNQHATTGSLLLEVGTSGNTLTQAINAINVFSKNLADYLLL
ncbi:MAG: stage II sporulation protein P [Clostridia bacterium]